MNEIPEMWRPDLYHPLTAHFPIGLLLITPVTFLLWLFFRNKTAGRFYAFTSSFLLWTGIITFWITVYTGELAYNVQVRLICDPTVLKDHIRWAYIAGGLFSIAAVTDLFRGLLAAENRKFLMYFIIALVIPGTAALGYTGHLGAQLVYQQAAGVYVPSENCKEFE